MPELEKDSFVVCKNSQGNEFRAMILQMSRHGVVFEVYNPYSIVQLSEVLRECKIYVDGRVVYSGRLVVSQLLSTDVVLICKSTLADGWLDVNLFASFHKEGRLTQELNEFLETWKKGEQVIPEFKLLVADMQTLLSDLRRWFDQVETGIRSDPTSETESTGRAVVEELQEPVFNICRPVFERFEALCSTIDQEAQLVHSAYVKHQLHPLILCSPFVYRTFSKPLGYAGDYEMVNMMLRDPIEGSSLFAKMINTYFLSSAPVIAHQNRIDYLVEMLKGEVQRNTQQMKKTRILNLGCGPAGEVQRFLRDYDFCEQAEFTLLDFNEETLAYTQEILNKIRSEDKREVLIQFMQRSVHQILKGAAKSMIGGPYDLVYCAGLFDYLSDRVCKRLVKTFYDLLVPGGLLVVTNVDPSNPNIHWMEYGLEWHLIYRDSAQLLKFHPNPNMDNYCRVHRDPIGVNVFLEIRRGQSV